MLAGLPPVGFLAARNLPRAQQFYSDTLGLPLLGDDGDALLFDCQGTLLRVAKVSRFAPAAHTVFGWQVPDVNRIVGALASSGVRCEQYAGMTQERNGVWVAPSGARVAWFKDPEGNVLSLTEMPGG